MSWADLWDASDRREGRGGAVATFGKMQNSQTAASHRALEDKQFKIRIIA